MASNRTNYAKWTVVRHGESTWNTRRLIQGQNDTSRLTEQGQSQVRALASELRNDHYDAILSSDLTRCVETAALLAEVLGGAILTTKLLRERSFGVAESRPSNVLTPSITGIEGTHVINEDAHPEMGESLRELYDRSGRFVRETIETYGDARLLVVTHGGTIRAMEAYVSGTSIEEWHWGGVANCSRWELTVPIPLP